MKYFTLSIAFTAAASAGVAHGHGNAIVINSTGAAITVRGGLSLTEGFASRSYDHSEDSYADIGFGNTLAWTTPGFEPQGDAIGLPISLEVLSRPDFTATPLAQRWLWYWDAGADEVVAAANDPFLAINPVDASTPLVFTQTVGPAGGDVIEVPVNGGFGHHPIEFALDDTGPAAFGVYGFFARITSPGLAPSEPILIALNYGMSVGQFIDGTEQINRAAGIRGDYNNDLAVDGADFLLWQRQVGGVGKLPADGSLNQVVDGPDLALWQERFGDQLELEAATLPVPEPGSVLLVVAAWAGMFARRRACHWRVASARVCHWRVASANCR
jgi:hypothetical protein